MPFLQDPVAEIVDTYAWQARRERIQAQASSFTPQSAELLSNYARSAPWIKPGVSLGLARSGIPVDDPMVQQISDLSLWHNTRQTGAGGTYGREVRAAQINPGQTVQEKAQQTPGLFGAFRAAAGQGIQEGVRQHGFLPVEQIVEQHPELATVLRSARKIIKDGYIVRPRNARTERGRTFDRVEQAFLDAGVDLPYIVAQDSPTQDAGRAKILRIVPDEEAVEGRPRTRVEDVGDLLGLVAEEESSGGGGMFPGVPGGPQLDVPLRQRRPDPIVAQQLEAAGIQYDPNNPLAFTSMVIQPAGMLMNAPVQELQGQFRNVVSAARGGDPNFLESQSDLGVMLGDQGDHALSPGTGYFVDPESEVAKERRAREAKRGLIGDHVITIGRFLADTVTEPDTNAFNVLSGTVDAGVQLADPSALALGKIGKVRTARSLFEVEEAGRVLSAADSGFDVAGRVRGLRRALHGPTTASWLDSDAGVQSINALTNEQSPARIWIAMGRRTDPRLAARLADTRTSDETRGVLEEVLGPYIRSPAELEAAAKNIGTDFATDPLMAGMNKLNPRISQSRMLRWMPTSQLDTDDPRQFATQLERHMVNAKVPVSLQEEIINDVARAETRGGLFQAATKAMEHEEGILVKHGISAEHARSVTTLFRESYDAHWNGLVDEVGDDVPVWTKMLDNGEMVEVPGPHLVLEHLNRYIPLPDARVIRRLTSKYRFLTTTKGAEAFGQNRLPIALMDFLTQEVWKVGTLLGRFPAWTTRVVGESQIRMATANLDSAFRHPISFFGYALGKRGGISPAGISLDDIEDFKGSLTTGHGGWISRPGTSSTSKPIVIPKREEYQTQFMRAWADELALIHADPISRHVLQFGVDETERWLRVGTEGQKQLKFLQESHPGNLISHEQIKNYLHGTVARRITMKTGGNTELITALKTGRLGDTSILVNTNQTNGKFIKALDSYIDAAPDNVRGFEVDVRSSGVRFPERYNRAVDWMFAHTMGLADNWWDRAPTFKQYLWQHTRQLLQYATPEAQQTILANADKANLPSRLMKGLNRATRVSGDLTVEEIDLLARGYAADSSKKLLYDLSEKGQLADAARIIAPFGNAYQEIFGAWGKLMGEIGGPGPAGKLIGAAKILRRSQQLIEGARGEDFGSVVGAPAGEGFFFKDEYGEEVFVIPGSQFLTQSLTRSNVPVPLTGRVQGLNMVGNIIPGLGPVAAIPVAWMIQNKPQFNGVHDLLLPYGAPGERSKSDITQILNYAPPWMRRAFDAATNGAYDQRLWGNAQKDAMAYLYSTGEYDTNTREGMQELLADSKTAAQDLYIIRALAQTFSPTTPSFRFLVEDKSGALLATSVLVEDYYALQEADYDNAGKNFLELYGEQAILAIMPKSGSSYYGIPRNKDQLNFVLNNPDIKKNFPSVYGLFLPQTDEFDYEVYLRSFITGEREDITPTQWLNLSNNMRADMIYNQYVEKVGNRTDQAASDYLAMVREKVDELFPSGPTGTPEKPDTDEMIRQLYEAVDDETLMSTDAGQGLKLYLQYRDQAQAYAEALQLRSFDKAKAALPARQWLNRVAQAILERHPDFKIMWDIVFSREARLEEGEEEDGTETASAGRGSP